MTNHSNTRTVLKAVTEASGLPRRKAFAAIREGRVSVGGVTTTEPSSAYQGGVIALDGRDLGAERRALVYLMLNKPAGVITTMSDTHARETAAGLIPVEMRAPGLHPVGRLDRDTTGLLVFTNDGRLTYKLTHPSHEVEKEYWLRTRPALDDSALDALWAGVEVDGQVRQPVDLYRLPPESDFDISITISEGRKRQVRRMVEAIGARATALTRVREGPLVLDGLPEGEVRRLTKDELRALGVRPARGASRGPESRSRRSTPRR